MNNKNGFCGCPPESSGSDDYDELVKNRKRDIHIIMCINYGLEN